MLVTSIFSIFFHKNVFYLFFKRQFRSFMPYLTRRLQILSICTMLKFVVWKELDDIVPVYKYNLSSEGVSSRAGFFFPISALCFGKRWFQKSLRCWLVVLGFNGTLTAKSCHGGRWRTCVSWLSHTPVLTQLSFQSHRLHFSHASAEVRGDNTPRRKESSSQPGIELTTTRSWVWCAHHWATGAGSMY